jgi:hypothetical protein
MEKVEFNGLMERFMMENIKMIKSMDMVLLVGQMVENMLVSGKMENNMEEENTSFLIKVEK